MEKSAQTAVLRDTERDEDLRAVPEEAGYSLSESDLIGIAFTDYLDFCVDSLVGLGLAEIDALEAIFGVATVLAESEQLPVFPEEDEDPVGQGEWLVAAADLEFLKIVAEALEG